MKELTRQKLPKWFEGDVYEVGDEVRNPFSGEGVFLTADELSMYDLIKGCEMVLTMGMPFDQDEVVKTMQKGISWFRRQNPAAYMTLLD